MIRWETPETTSTSPPSSSSNHSAPAAHRFDIPVAGGVARVRFSDRAAGSFSSRPPTAVSEALRQQFVAQPWSWLNQVHGAAVLTVDGPGDRAGSEGDALLSSAWGCALAVQVADCAPIALIGQQATIAVVHAGWRGLADGIVEASVAAAREAGAGELTAIVGPHIGPECYEFGPDLLIEMEGRFGAAVRSRTTAGAPAFDLGRAVRSTLEASGVGDVVAVARCTSCEPEHYFSHRARHETGRHALVAWLELEA
jgi:YfiH family protein